MTRTMLGCVMALVIGCGGGSSAADEPAGGTTSGGQETSEAGEPSSTDTTQPAEGTTLTADDCSARGGTLVGDIGDGATQRPDYLCPNGQPPIGRVAVGIEGSVCCGS